MSGINTYGYVLGNPIKYVDSFGLDRYDIWQAHQNTKSNPNCVSVSFGTDVGAAGVGWGWGYGGYTEGFDLSWQINDYTPVTNSCGSTSCSCKN